MRLALTAFFFVTVGCGSSSQPQQQPLPEGTGPTPAADDAGIPEDTGVRALKQGHLLASVPQNLILDGTFRDQGWGKFYVPLLNPNNGEYLASRPYGASPLGPSITVGILKDPKATDDKSRTVNCIGGFLGGKGPFAAGVWVTRATVAGAAKDLEQDDTVFRAFVSKDSTTVGWPLTRTTSVVLGGRTWWRFETKVDEDLTAGYLIIRVGPKGGAVWAQAPEVLPLSALPAEKAMSLKTPSSMHVLEADELDAIQAYKRMPAHLGVPKLPPLRPGHSTPIFPAE